MSGKKSVEKLKIVLTNRNTLPFLKPALKSIQENQVFSNDVVVYDDNSNSADTDWIKENSTKYGYSYHLVKETCGKDYDRMGITLLYNKIVKEHEDEDVPIMLGHADMVYGPGFDKELAEHLVPGTICCSTRIEPPLFPPQPGAKITESFGTSPEDFSLKKFNERVRELRNEYADKTSDGVFAPMAFFKEDWDEVGGINPEFYPQSKEDSQIQYEWKLLGKNFVQPWDSLVYHFCGRGSRRKDDAKTDSEEWKKSNEKNLRNFQRLYKEFPRYTETQHPNPPQYLAKISLCVPTHNNEETIYDLLYRHEPVFDEVILIDDNSTDKTVEEARRYWKEHVEPNSLCEDKELKVVSHDLSDDFGRMHNVGHEHASFPWVFFLDSDEMLDDVLLNLVNRYAVSCEINKKECVAFARKNFLDGVLVNDVPRKDWTRKGLEQVRKKQEGVVPEIEQNFDWQCRLNRKHVKWVRKVHEMPEPFFKALQSQGSDEEATGKVALQQDGRILHYKSLEKQKKADKHYEQIQASKGPEKAKATKDTTKSESREPGEVCVPEKALVVNSVLFTNEGISRHAREETRILKKLGWNTKITSNLTTKTPKEFFDKQYHTILPTDHPDVIHYINQPPIRENNMSMSLAGNLNKPNIVYYLAYEGDQLPPEWVNVMKQPNVKKVLTPSTYCKKVFEDHGIKNVSVLPHGINPETFCPEQKPLSLPPQLKNKTLFLFAGTYRGLKNDRKGITPLMKAWKKFKKTSEGQDCALILKLNNVYFQGSEQDWKEKVANLGISDELDCVVIDTELNDESLAGLLSRVDYTVLPSLSEGFGLFALESLACATPVIATRTSGFLDFLNDDNALLIDVARQIKAQPIHPYKGKTHHARWDMPSIDHLSELLSKAVTEKSEWAKKAKVESKKVRRDCSWEKVGKSLSEHLESVKH